MFDLRAAAEPGSGAKAWLTLTVLAVEDIEDALGHKALRLRKRLTRSVDMIHRRIDNLRAAVERDKDYALTDNDCAAIQRAIDGFGESLGGVLSDRYIYMVREKGGLDTVKLIEEPEVFFGSAWASLPGLVRGDFRQAALCLAFDLHTACGFHSVRAVEAMTRQWYDSILGKPNQYPKLATIIKKIENELQRTGKLGDAEESVLDFLHKIRKHDRNPLAHPERSMQDHEANLLFTDCVSTVSAILRYMNPQLRPPSRLLQSP